MARTVKHRHDTAHVGLIPTDQLGTGTASAGTVLFGDQTWGVLPKLILTLTNKSGGSVAAGDVVIIDTANDSAFTTTTTGQAEVSVGVAQATIANNAAGSVLVAGLAALVNVPSSMTRGRFLETHTVVKQATGSATRRAGSFGQFLTGGSTPAAWLWGQTDQTASGGGGADEFTTDGTKARLASGLDAVYQTATGTSSYVYLAGGFAEIGATNSVSLTPNDANPGGSGSAKVYIWGGHGLVLPFLSADPSGGDEEEAQVYYNDTIGKIRWFNGSVWADLGTGGGIARIVAPAAIANTETVVASYAMPANYMVAGTSFSIRAYGRLTSGVTGGSSIFRCRIGTTTLTGNIPATLTIANAGLVTNAPFLVEMLVTVRTSGAGGTVIGNVNVTGGAVGAFTIVGDVSALSAAVAVDTTAAKLIELTFISGNAGTTATFENAVIGVAHA